MTTHAAQAGLPELPIAHGELMIYDFDAKPRDPIRYREVFTAVQMREYAAEAVRAAKSVQPTRKALSDAELCVLLVEIDPETKRLPSGFRRFARAIEDAHGIGTQE